MPINTALPIYTTPLLSAASFVNSDGITAKTLIATNAGVQRIDGLVVSSNDTVDRTVSFLENDGSADHYLGSILVPAGSGYSVPRVNALGTIAPGTTGAIILPAGSSLKCAPTVAITATDTLTIIASGGIY